MDKYYAVTESSREGLRYVYAFDDKESFLTYADMMTNEEILEHGVSEERAVSLFAEIPLSSYLRHFAEVSKSEIIFNVFLEDYFSLFGNFPEMKMVKLRELEEWKAVAGFLVGGSFVRDLEGVVDGDYLYR